MCVSAQSPLEKDARKKTKSVFSLFEDEEKIDEVDAGKSIQKDTEKVRSLQSGFWQCRLMSSMFPSGAPWHCGLQGGKGSLVHLGPTHNGLPPTDSLGFLLNFQKEHEH